MNDVKLLHIKCCFFQFFNSLVALKNKIIFGPQEKVELTPLFLQRHLLFCLTGIRLRTVDEETKKQDVRNEPAGGGMFDVQTIMEMRRRALEEEEDDDDEEFNDWEE